MSLKMLFVSNMNFQMTNLKSFWLYLMAYTSCTATFLTPVLNMAKLQYLNTHLKNMKNNPWQDPLQKLPAVGAFVEISILDKKEPVESMHSTEKAMFGGGCWVVQCHAGDVSYLSWMPLHGNRNGETVMHWREWDVEEEQKQPPPPPPPRIIADSFATSSFCVVCASSLHRKRRWFGKWKIDGCIQPHCINFHRPPRKK